MLGVHHPLLKSVRKAVRRGGPVDAGWGVAEGPHLIEEALRVAGALHAVIAAENVAELWQRRVPDGVMVHRIAASTMEQISTVEANQGVLGLVRLPVQSIRELLGSTGPVVVLDGLQDPGNAGTIVRTAEAFGASGVVFLKGSVSPWNPKALRASAGSLLRVPVGLGEWDELEREINGWEMLAASVQGKELLPGMALARRSLILIGNEGNGLPEEHESAARTIRIPTERVESLNAALAAGVILYEVYRRRE